MIQWMYKIRWRQKIINIFIINNSKSTVNITNDVSQELVCFVYSVQLKVPSVKLTPHSTP